MTRPALQASTAGRLLVAETEDSALLHVGADYADALATLYMLGHEFEVVDGDDELAGLRVAPARTAGALAAA